MITNKIRAVLLVAGAGAALAGFSSGSWAAAERGGDRARAAQVLQKVQSENHHREPQRSEKQMHRDMKQIEKHYSSDRPYQDAVKKMPAEMREKMEQGAGERLSPDMKEKLQDRREDIGERREDLKELHYDKVERREDWQDRHEDRQDLHQDYRDLRHAETPEERKDEWNEIRDDRQELHQDNRDIRDDNHEIRDDRRDFRQDNRDVREDNRDIREEFHDNHPNAPERPFADPVKREEMRKELEGMTPEERQQKMQDMKQKFMEDRAQRQDERRAEFDKRWENASDEDKAQFCAKAQTRCAAEGEDGKFACGVAQSKCGN